MRIIISSDDSSAGGHIEGNRIGPGQKIAPFPLVIERMAPPKKRMPDQFCLDFMSADIAFANEGGITFVRKSTGGIKGMIVAALFVDPAIMALKRNRSPR